MSELGPLPSFVVWLLVAVGAIVLVCACVWFCVDDQEISCSAFCGRICCLPSEEEHTEKLHDPHTRHARRKGAVPGPAPNNGLGYWPMAPMAPVVPMPAPTAPPQNNGNGNANSNGGLYALLQVVLQQIQYLNDRLRRAEQRENEREQTEFDRMRARSQCPRLPSFQQIQRQPAKPPPISPAPPPAPTTEVPVPATPNATEETYTLPFI